MSNGPTMEQEAPAAAAGRPPVAAGSRLLRFVIAAGAVAVYKTVGYVLHLNLADYQLLGIPLLVLFQLGIHRQPLRTLWVRSGPPLRLDARLFLLWALFSLVPAYETLRAAQHADLASAALQSTGIVGAIGLAYALRAMRAATLRQLGLCLVTAGGIALLPQLLFVLLPHVVHLHLATGPAGAGTHLALLPSLQAGAETFLWGMPAGFVIEEVFFRGALDTYLHRGEHGTGWGSAVFVSALWGLWHLPNHPIPAQRLLPTIAGLLIAQIAVGVPLSLWWRKSGNLVVSNTTHALIDGARTVLAALA